MKAPSPLTFWAQLVALSPIVLAQGAYLKRKAPRMAPVLDNADRGEEQGSDTAAPLELVVVGESTAVGVGCQHRDEGMPVQLARAISRQRRVDVQWQVIGGNGLRARDIERLLQSQSDAPQTERKLAVVLLGVNDVVGLTSVKAWRESLIAIRQQLRRRGAKVVCLAPVPPMDGFTLLPQPLRRLLGLRARMLDAARHDVARVYPDVVAAETEFPLDATLLAQDGYHPGPAACAWWAEALAKQVNS
ncbi:MAG: SGNH/GDSL hydrolase family protein [Pseudomonadota bacterium]